ncbi:MAG: ABC transporter permease [Cyanobacteria bacterium P01_G01_bin.54]
MPLSPFHLLYVTVLALRGNPVRSLLTLTGVFMGVIAVNGTLQAQNISQRMIERQLASQEAPQLMSWPGQLSEADQQRFSQELGNIAVSSGMGWGYWSRVRYGEQEIFLDVQFVSQEHLKTKGLRLLQGRFFNEDDFRQFRAVGVIDQTVAAQLFPETDPLGKQLTVEGDIYTVIGVMEARPVERDGQIWSTMVVPLALYQARIGRREMSGVSLQPSNWRKLEQQQAQLEQLLQARFPDQEAWVWHNAEAIAEQQEILTLVSRGLLGLGAVALLISGVGIANITFASVLERTPEIGLRRAIGATPGDILAQFLLEALFLSLLGGVAAIAVVEVATRLVVTQFNLPYQFQISTVGLSLGAAMVVGAGSSLLPAQRASRIEPMSALRNE